MVTIVVTAAPVFPENTVLGAYRARDWAGGPPQPGDTPRASVTTFSEAVDAHGYAAITELLGETLYYVGAEVAGVWRWLTITTPKEVGGGGGGGSGTVKSVNGRSPDSQGAVVIPELVRAVEKPLGLQSGTVALDMAGESFVVFTVTPSGTITFAKPTNVPSSGGAFFEIKITGNHVFSLPFLARWEHGAEPTWDVATLSSVSRPAALSDDAGTTWAGVGSEPLPSGVIPFSSTPTTGQLGLYNAGTLTPTTPPWLEQTGVESLITTLKLQTKVQVEALIAALSPTELKPGAAIVANSTLVAGTLNRITVSGTKQTLPATATAGQLIAVFNESTGAIKVKGKQNPGAPTSTTETEVTGTETVLYVANGEVENVWIRIPLGSTPSLYEAFASLHFVEAAAGYREPGCRLEEHGSIVRLRGCLVVTATKTLKKDERLLTLPATKSPQNGSGEARIRIGGSDFDVDEGGKVTLRSADLLEGTKLGLDGVTFSVT